MNGVHKESQRVIVVEKLSHEQLRTLLVVGIYSDMDGAEDLFIHRMAWRL